MNRNNELISKIVDYFNNDKLTIKQLVLSALLFNNCKQSVRLKSMFQAHTDHTDMLVQLRALHTEKQKEFVYFFQTLKPKYSD